MSFITNVIKMAWPSDFGARIFLVEFEVDLYSISAFDEHDIPMSAVIRRSALLRQAEYLAGRIAAKECLKELGCSNYYVGAGKHGAPMWPIGTIGSISHDKGCAVAVSLLEDAQGPVKGIGIDLQSMPTAPFLRAIEGTALTKREIETLSSYSESSDELKFAVVAIFSAKEAFFKAAYRRVGNYFDFKAVQVDELNFMERWVSLLLMTDLAPGFGPGYRMRVHFTCLKSGQILTIARCAT
jgi:enterobactin synthetase component D